MKIFLSHASQDKAVAESIAFSLRNRGHSVFLDRDDLPAGQSYDQQIERAVKASDAFIFLVSPDSVAAGRYTLTELSFARRRWRDPNGRVLPVVVRKTPMDDVPAYLKAVTLLEPIGNVTAETSAAVDDLGRGEKARAWALWFGGIGLVAGIAASFLPFMGKSFLGLTGDYIKPDIGLALGLQLAVACYVFRVSESLPRLAALVLAAGVAWVVLGPLTSNLIPARDWVAIGNVDVDKEALKTTIGEEEAGNLANAVSAAKAMNRLSGYLLSFVRYFVMGGGVLMVLMLAAAVALKLELDWRSALIGLLMIAAAASLLVLIDSIHVGFQQFTILGNPDKYDSAVTLWSSPTIMAIVGVWHAFTLSAFGVWLARMAD